MAVAKLQLFDLLTAPVPEAVEGGLWAATAQSGPHLADPAERLVLALPVQRFSLPIERSRPIIRVVVILEKTADHFDVFDPTPEVLNRGG